MKQKMSIALLALALVGCEQPSSSNEKEASVSYVGESGSSVEVPVVKVVTTGTAAPFSTRDKQGVLEGIDVDVMHAIGDLEGFQVEFFQEPWQKVLPNITSGKYHIAVNGINYTEERNQQYGVSVSYLDNPSAFMYRAENLNPPKYLADLHNLSVGVMADSKQDTQVSSVEGSHIVRYTNMYLAYKAMAKGEIDVVAYDMPAMQQLSNNYAEFAVKITPYEDLQEKTSGAVFIVAKDNMELLEKINAGIAKIKQSGELEAIKSKWLGVE